MRIFPTFLPLILSAAFSIIFPISTSHGDQRDQNVDLELVLAVDVSGSIDEEEARLQRNGYVSAFRSPEVINAIRSGFKKRIAVTYFEWAGFDFQSPTIEWTVIFDEASAHAFAARLASIPIQTGPYTSISGAIDFAVPLFENNGFEGPRRVIDISGDGPNNSGRLVTLARQEALAKGITINGLPIINDRPSRFGRRPMPNLDLYYRKCVIGGPRAFLVVAENFQAFARAVRKKLILEIVGITPNGGQRVLSRNGRTAPVPKPLAPLLVSADGREIPPCNIGESRRRTWWEDSY